MVCATADELQARLALRSLFSAQRESAREAASKAEEDAAPSTSSFHKALRAEVDDVLKAGLNKRLKSLEQKVNKLLDSDGAASKTSAAASRDIGSGSLKSGAPSKPRDVQEATVQTEDVTLPESKRLAEAVEKALVQSVAASKPPPKRYMPSRIQRRQVDPPEKDEQIHRETSVLQATFGCLRQIAQSRERQITSLKEQLEHVQRLYAEQTATTQASSADLAELQRNPSHAAHLRQRAVEKRRKHISEMRAALEKTRDQGVRHQALAVQQRVYHNQNDILALRGGTDALKWHPAGEVFLEPAPVPIGDEKSESWDVGTAVANPYVVDSWPFEPNVMARKCFNAEPPMTILGPMMGVKEETEQDIINEARRLPGLNLRLPRPDSDDDEFDDRYQGPSETSRSL
mmetsp:Transcript_21395/g.40984  ORF Transcript_21395/g.40984 Transcript_21395/m.40984 type:complete len:402 (+) Transcript_21395:73-1278(+)